MRRLIGQVSWEEAHNPDGSLRPGYADIENPDLTRERAEEAAKKRLADWLKKASPRDRADYEIAKAVTEKIDGWLDSPVDLPREVWDHMAVLACRDVAHEMGVSSQRVAYASSSHDEYSPVSHPMPWSRYPAKRKKRAKKS